LVSPSPSPLFSKPYLLLDHDLADAFVQAMEKFGFPGLSAFDIVETGKQVREEIAAKDPEKAAGL
jgi:hypothetical protein